MNELTQNGLKELLEYHPKSGLFTWRVDRSYVKAGSIAGSLTKKGYIRIAINGRRYFAHRLAFLYMTGDWPRYRACHDNQNPADNRWKNLYDATNQDNQRNMKLPSHNTSGRIGVHWDKRDSRWCAQIKIDGRSKHLGMFEDFDEAVKTRKAAEKKNGFHENHGRLVA